MTSPRKLSREKAFYFFTSIGNYTGESAASLEEFAKKVEQVSVRSLEFHLRRGDFQRWVAEALQDKDLAEEIKNLQYRSPTGDALRDQLHRIVQKGIRN
jgi:hypothetical protein